MSQLPTQERVVSQAPSASYEVSQDLSAQYQPTTFHGNNPAHDSPLRQDQRAESYSHHSTRATYPYQREEDVAFRAPSVHAILNPTSDQASQQGSETQSLPSDQRYSIRPHSTGFHPSSFSQQPSEFDPTASHTPIAPGAPVAGLQQPSPTISSPPYHGPPEPLRRPPPIETSSISQEVRETQGAVSPTKRRKLVQSPPAGENNTQVEANQVKRSSHFRQSSLEGANVSPTRLGDIGWNSDDPPSRPAGKRHDRYSSVSLSQDSGKSLDQPQLMALQTADGPIYFPVDTQAASRLADERRRRNAGASARFRQRRKEREQASSREIEDLRIIIRDLREDVDFYRRERDYLAGELLQNQDRSRHFPRPPSPRRYRSTSQPDDSAALNQGIDPRGMSPSYQGLGSKDTAEALMRDSFQPITPRTDPHPGTKTPRQHPYGERSESFSHIRPLAPQVGEQYQSSPGRSGHARPPYGT